MMTLTIRKRLLLQAIAAPLFVALAILSAFLGFQTVKKATDTALLLNEVMHHLQDSVKSLGDFVITQGGPESRTAAREAILKTNEKFLEFKGTATFSTVDPVLAAQLESVSTEMRSFLTIQRGAIDDNTMIKYGRLSVRIDALIARLQSIVDDSLLEMEQRKRRVFIITTGIFVLSVVLLSYLFGSSFRLISSQLLRSKEMIASIVAGDLTRQGDIAGSDELADIGRAMNQMSLHLKGMILQILAITDAISVAAAAITDAHSKALRIADTQKEAIQGTATAISSMNSSIANVAEKAEDLSTLSESTASSIIQLESSIRSVAENASVFNESTEAAASSIAKMTSAVKLISENTEQLITSSEETATAMIQLKASALEIEQSAVTSVDLAERVDSEASEKGLKSLEAVRDGMGATREHVGELMTNIRSLGARSNDIGKVLEVISEITDQAKLLALNASILAAQAGEHGKGFGVVASEIHGLSDRTAEHTREIAAIIAAIQKEIKTSAGMTQKSMESVEKGLGLFSEMENALGSIKKSSTTATEMAKSIKRAAAEEVSTINHINTTIQDMKDQIRRIGQSIAEQHKGSRYLIDAAERMRSASLNVKNATQEQSEGSKNITVAVNSVNQQASEIAAATDGQKLKSGEIVAAVGMITTTLDELNNSSRGLDELIAALNSQAQNLRKEIGKFKV